MKKKERGKGSSGGAFMPQKERSHGRSARANHG